MAIKRTDPKTGEVTKTYEGSVLCRRESNGYHDSDFYAIVWDEEEQTLSRVVYATTRGPTNATCAVDATEEVKEKARDWLHDWARRESLRTQRANAEKIVPGRRVKVVRGRKVPIGTVATVYATREREIRGNTIHEVALLMEDGSQQGTYEANLVVVNQEQFISEEEAEKDADSFVEGDPWHIPFVIPGYVAF